MCVYAQAIATCKPFTERALFFCMPASNITFQEREALNRLKEDNALVTV